MRGGGRRSTARPHHLRGDHRRESAPEEQRLARRARGVDPIRAEAHTAARRGEAAARDYRLAATAFVGGVNGLLHDYSAGWVDATLDEVVDELVGQLLALLRPPGPRPAD